ncbi:hypothetical protein CC80DRAFT_509164 [Byssothecium circinans]|uniref:Uncharacterized protein n=1 Tax=Byssothecium circinans TaxID=147558 RepID=A0A6A5TFR3_9PLEO|nr:hypothetical protein CC80DRAFT_509164 [Byssothecium circinans]
MCHTPHATYRLCHHSIPCNRLTRCTWALKHPDVPRCPYHKALPVYLVPGLCLGCEDEENELERQWEKELREIEEMEEDEDEEGWEDEDESGRGSGSEDESEDDFEKMWADYVGVDDESDSWD